MDWIKIMCNLLDNRKIKIIRREPEGNTLVLLWLLMLTEAGKCNRGGYLMISDQTPYTDETLGMVTDIPLPTVQLGLAIFSRLEMIDIQDQAFFIKNWHKYQSEDKLAERRRKDRIRQQRHREKQRSKMLISPDKLVSRDRHVNMSRDVTAENRQEKNRVEKKTTTEQIRSLLAETPFVKISNTELQALEKRHGFECLLQAADIAAETWRRNPEERRNPGGYLNTLCNALVVPAWYVPFAERQKMKQEMLNRKKKIKEAQAAQKAHEDEERIAIETLWNSLPDEERKEYLEQVRSALPAGVDLPETILELMARGLAGQQCSRARMIEGTARSCGK